MRGRERKGEKEERNKEKKWKRGTERKKRK